MLVFTFPTAFRSLATLCSTGVLSLISRNYGNDEHAQLEVREVAAEMLRLVEEQGDFPMTIEAMTAAGMLPVKENEE